MATTLKRRIVYILCFVLLFSVTLTGCKKKPTQEEPPEDTSSQENLEENGEYPVTIREYEILSRPDRVISLANSITEKVYDLGLEDRLVGVSTYCEYPPQARDLPRAGTAQLPEVNVIQDLEATTVLTSAPLSGMESALLAERGIQVIVLPGAETLGDVWQQYHDIATIFEGKEMGDTLANDTITPAKQWLENLRETIAPLSTEEIPSLYLKRLEFTVATGDSVEQELMEILGLTNIAAEKTDWYYPEVEAKEGEGLGDFQSLAMILMDENDVDIKMLEQNDFYKVLQATLKDHYIYIDSLAIERQGFSMLSELSRIAGELWPEETLPVWDGGFDDFDVWPEDETEEEDGDSAEEPDQDQDATDSAG